MELLNFFQAMKNKSNLPDSVRVAVVGVKSNKKLMTMKDKDKMWPTEYSSPVKTGVM